MTPGSALSGTRRFGGTYRLHLQGCRIFQQSSEHASAGVISQKKILFKTTAVKISNPVYILVEYKASLVCRRLLFTDSVGIESVYQ
jgi:hypothetical protein